jgi:hypothetical protein
VITYRKQSDVVRADYIQHLIDLKKKGTEAYSAAEVNNGNGPKGFAPEQNSKVMDRAHSAWPHSQIHLHGVVLN